MEALQTAIITAGAVACVWIVASLGLASCDRSGENYHEQEMACIAQGGTYTTTCIWTKETQP